MQDPRRAADAALCRGIRVSRPAAADLWRIPAAEEDEEAARGARRRADLAAEAAARADDAIFFLPSSLSLAALDRKSVV